MKQLSFFLFCFSLSILGAQTCDPSELITVQTRANDTDSAIDWELNKHYSFYNPTCTSQNTLLVHLVGSFDNPSSTLLFPELAGNNGFHVISLKYPNDVAAQTACGNDSDPNCYLLFRREIIEGVDFSTAVTVDASNSINNRLIKLLQYLDTNHPEQNWNNYFSNQLVNWDNIIFSGHSQGGGHAAMIGINKSIKRVLMFASPNDYSTFFNSSAPWTATPQLAPDYARYYGFNNLNDDVVNFSEQFEIWNNLGMTTFGDSIDVQTSSYPYSNSHQLYTTYETTGIGANHNAVIRDNKTPFDSLGIPLYEPVWKYMLGLSSSMTAVHNLNDTFGKISIYPNPSKDHFTIKLDFATKKNISISIYSILGELIAVVNNVQKNTLRIDTNKFEAGLYIVCAQSSNKIIAKQKIIIQK